MNQFTQIPPGVRFNPNGEEVILRYLIPKINGCNLPWPWIAEKDAYSDCPSTVFGDMDPRYWTIEKDDDTTTSSIHAFVKVTKSSSNRKSRRVHSGGTWHGHIGSKKIKNSDNGETIGCMKNLTFKHHDKGRDDPKWMMREYSLAGAGLKAIGNRRDDIVLCKITKVEKEDKEFDRPLTDKADHIGNPPRSPLLPQQMDYVPIAHEFGNPCMQPLGSVVPDQTWQYSIAMAHEFGSPYMQPLGSVAPDQPCLESVSMSYEFENQRLQPLGSIVSDQPCLDIVLMAHEFGNPQLQPLGSIVPDQPCLDFVSMAHEFGNPQQQLFGSVGLDRSCLDSAAMAHEFGNLRPQSLGSIVPDQPCLDSVTLAYEYGNPRPQSLGSVVPNQPCLDYVPMSHEFESLRLQLLGSIVPDQPCLDYVPMDHEFENPQLQLLGSIVLSDQSCLNSVPMAHEVENPQLQLFGSIVPDQSCLDIMPMAHELENPQVQPLGSIVPDQSCLDSVLMAHEFGNPQLQSLGFVPEQPWLDSVAMPHEFENPHPLGFLVSEDQPPLYSPMIEHPIGTPAAVAGGPTTNRRPAQEESTIIGHKSFWENFSPELKPEGFPKTSEEFNKMLEFNDTPAAASSTTPVGTPMIQELEDVALQIKLTDTLEVLEVEDDFSYLVVDHIGLPAKVPRAASFSCG